jgi:hypothetical protein
MSRVGAVYQASSFCRAKFSFVSHETGFVSILQNPAYGADKLY